MPAAVIWTDDRVDLLTRLWTAGRSAAEIARTLACGVSRNAVIGKVYRLGLSGRGIKAGRRPARPLPPARRRRVKSRPPMRGPRVRPLQVSPSAALEPGDGQATVLTVGRHACRWPYGDPLADDFALCGRPAVRGAYCAAHAERAYGPLSHRPAQASWFALPAYAEAELDMGDREGLP